MDEVESLRTDPIFTLEEFSNISIDPGKVKKRLRNNAKETKEIKKEKWIRILIYSERYDQGLDLYTGEEASKEVMPIRRLIQ